jgi:hypothetical protein
MPDGHHLADGGRDDIFDLTLALADEYGLALRSGLSQPLRAVVPVKCGEWTDRPG